MGKGIELFFVIREFFVSSGFFNNANHFLASDLLLLGLGNGVEGEATLDEVIVEETGSLFPSLRYRAV